MTRPALIARVCLAPPCILALAVVAAGAPDPQKSLYAPSQLTTASGEYADADNYFEAADCGECHVDQYEAWLGSLHSRAHHDSIYRAFAERAREEGGEDLYLFCSSCHIPGAVAVGEVPGAPDGKHTFLTDEGVTCDACHNVSRVLPVHGGAGANASLVLEEGETRYGPLPDPVDEASHESAYLELYTKSMFCSACHTLVHPHNGLVIENTYQEWEEGPFAEAGVHCQDCHMRTVEQAMEVARTRRPVRVPGRTYDEGELRPDVHDHFFAGANSNAGLTGSSDRHAEMARERLRSAAALALRLPKTAVAGQTAAVTVEVTNKGAGHAIPSSITELRQVWIDLQVQDAEGREVYRSGQVADNGQVDPSAVMYHSVLADEEGEVTYLPWRAARIVEEKLIPAGQTVRERYDVPVPGGVPGPLRVQARLRYRSAPQEVMDDLFGRGRFAFEIVDMAAAEAALRLAVP